jgi:hypothetical protein
LARVLARHAAKLDLDPPDDAETLLATYADETRQPSTLIFGSFSLS